jgi:hypothetical protein
MRNGLAGQPIPPSELNRSMFRASSRPHTDNEDLWPHPRPIAGRLNDIDADDLADADADYGHPTYLRRFGWFVRYPRWEARMGVNIPSRRRCDYIRLGEFTVAQVNHAVKTDGSNIKERFDYNLTDHIKHLNSIAAQWFQRVPGEFSKVKGKQYQDDENEWIWWWHNERFWELIEEHPELLDATTAADWAQAGVRWPFPTDILRLMNDFNHRWTQQTHLPGMNGEPRQHRDYRSIEAQGKRIIAVCDDFGYVYSPPHVRKGRDKPQKWSPSGSSDDDSDGDDNDNEPKPPRKKPRITKKPKGKDRPKKAAKDGKGNLKTKQVDEEEEENKFQPPNWDPSFSSSEDGDDDEDEPQAKRKKPSTTKKPKRKYTSKKKYDDVKDNSGARRVDEEEEEEPESSDDGETSPDKQPLKKPTKTTPKGITGKRKRGQDDEDGSEYDGGSPGPESGKQGSGLRRSGRNQRRK